ncbi:PTS system, cellobiose-specific IIB component [Kosakonia arachidis]|uniref:PTS system, cellobiose-specific IIB component n=2 Tax=Kosakonia arachidis TaxID=551989 RepID=A0A1I6YCQ0_9ENTR|nr:PTS system, cellobiose-specific IIB component [Kosakonia arachidis]
MQILLCCAAGMSTSMLVSKMQDVARERGLEVILRAIPVADFERSFEEADVILLGPQVQYEAARLSAIAAPQGKAVAVIDMMDYGMMRAEQVLDKALALYPV